MTETKLRNYRLALLDRCISSLETFELWGKRESTTQMIKQLKCLIPIVEEEIRVGEEWIQTQLQIHKDLQCEPDCNCWNRTQVRNNLGKNSSVEEQKKQSVGQGEE